jgi:pimeloyl-ACP methyl ester carboxylesterase
LLLCRAVLPSSLWATTALLLSAVVSASCGLGFLEGGPPGIAVHQTSVRLHDHDLTLHLVAGLGHPEGPLLLYATGDAGWWGGDKGLFDHLAPIGYPVAGFSARDYTHHLKQPDDKETPRQLADDYLAIIRASEESLGLPATTRVVLVGKSRGSGLAVAAGENPRVRVHLRGVLAVALTGEEEYIEHREPDLPPGTLVMLNTYDVLPRLGSVPVAVIQSTRDQYLPADTARKRFGPDTPVRQFHAIDAANHNFGGKVTELYDEIDRCLEWILNS